MKRNLLILLGFMLFVSSAVAQQRSVGQWSLSMQGGLTTTDGYYGELQAERYSASRSTVIVSGTFLNSRYIASDEYKFSVNQYFAGCRWGYGLPVSRLFFLNLSAGGILGYENPPVRTQENKVLRYDSKFNFGLTAAAQVELIISRKISFVIDPRMMYLFNTNFENFIFTGGAGVKVYF